MDPRRHAYLDAMGITAWAARTRRSVQPPVAGAGESPEAGGSGQRPGSDTGAGPPPAGAGAAEPKRKVDAGSPTARGREGREAPLPDDAWPEAPPLEVYETAAAQASPAAEDPVADMDGAPPPGGEASAGVATLDWPALEQVVRGCRQCVLHESRTNVVFGVGARDAQLMFIGEAPGGEEDRRGEPFVGAAGQLLNAMLAAIGLEREEVFIANILKCRPPGNRDPHVEEVAACNAYLQRQVDLVAPRLIVALGRVAAQNCLGTSAPLGRLRGKLHSFGERGTPLLATYHPAYLLRSPSQKRKSWEDLKRIREALRS